MGEIRDRVTASVEPVCLQSHQPWSSCSGFASTECNRAGPITILTTLTDYKPTCKASFRAHCRSGAVQLRHVNPLVVLLLIKCIVHHLGGVNDRLETVGAQEATGATVLLVSNLIPEAQYVGPKNIRILEKYPLVLSKELRVFFLAIWTYSTSSSRNSTS